MKQEAEAHAEEDKRQKETVEAKNELDNIVFQVEKQVKDAGDQVPADIKTKIDEEIAEAKKILEKADLTKDEAQAAKEKLINFMQANAQAFQQAAGSAGAETGDAGAGAEAPKQDDVVDADFEVVDDEKKDGE
jgi:molecular chaperone DnaK